MVVTSKWQDVKFTYCRCFFLKAVLIPRLFRNKSDYFLRYCTFPTKCCSFGFPIAFTFPQFPPPRNLPRGQFWSFFYNNLHLGGSFGYRLNFFPTAGNNSILGDSFGYNYNRGLGVLARAEQNHPLL